MATARDAHASKNITVVKLEDHKTSTENQVEEEQSESYMTKDDYDDHRDDVVAQNSDDMNGQNSKVCEHCGEVILISNKLNGHKMSRRQSIVIFKMNHKCQVTVMKKKERKSCEVPAQVAQHNHARSAAVHLAGPRPCQHEQGHVHHVPQQPHLLYQ